MSSQGYKGLGLTFARQGKVDLAVSMFQQAVAKNAKDHDAFFDLAISYADTKQYDKAADAYENVLEIFPADVEAMHNLGVLYFRDLHDVERAKKYFKKALATNPNYGNAAIAQQVLAWDDMTNRNTE
jgi:Flp pilus assembly protein TadD